MRDIQSEEPEIFVPIERVGIKNLYYPIKVLTKKKTFQDSIAEIRMSVYLPENNRGTHMSRFLELIEKYKNDVSKLSLNKCLYELKDKFNTDNCYIELTFPYFIEKKSPVKKIKSIMKIKCGLSSEIKNNELLQTVHISVPVTTLCPCSKEISKYGAHNQRAYVHTVIETDDEFIWFEDVVQIIEESASAPIYPILKREDEKFVIEQAYENPRFVEDLVRLVYVKIRDKYKHQIRRLKIRVESDESIHQHMAFAEMRKNFHSTTEYGFEELYEVEEE